MTRFVFAMTSAVYDGVNCSFRWIISRGRPEGKDMEPLFQMLLRIPVWYFGPGWVSHLWWWQQARFNPPVVGRLRAGKQTIAVWFRNRKPGANWTFQSSCDLISTPCVSEGVCQSPAHMRRSRRGTEVAGLSPAALHLTAHSGASLALLLAAIFQTDPLSKIANSFHRR